MDTRSKVADAWWAYSRGALRLILLVLALVFAEGDSRDRLRSQGYMDPV